MKKAIALHLWERGRRLEIKLKCKKGQKDTEEFD